MKIQNIRLGHATNSSSSHSMIFDPNLKGVRDDEDADFGWGFFTASSTRTKSNYVAAMVRSQLESSYPTALIDAIMIGLGLPKTDARVDHQSTYTLPKSFGYDSIDIEFLKEFKEFILKEGIVILGGNDNSDTSHSLYDESKVVKFDGWTTSGFSTVCRKEGDWWVLYSPISGHRVVLSFKDNPSEFKPKTPMLMDIKITEYCDFGCAFCYTNSTRNGEHIAPEAVFNYAMKIADANVFEVAIGGGEPTRCPSFDSFVSILSRQGVKVNFTTKDTKWLEDEIRATEIINNIGAFALSVEDTKGLNRVVAIFEYRNYDWNKLTLQVIPAAITEFALRSILEWAFDNDIRVTLLGFKETGRGAKFKEIAVNRSWNKFDELRWIEVLKDLNNKHKLGTISIDTTLAARYEQQLKAIDLPEWLYHIKEGEYSMYMDMVKHQYGPSSYHLDKLVPIKDKWDTIASMFKTIEPV